MGSYPLDCYDYKGTCWNNPSNHYVLFSKFSPFSDFVRISLRPVEAQKDFQSVRNLIQFGPLIHSLTAGVHIVELFLYQIVFDWRLKYFWLSIKSISDRVPMQQEHETHLVDVSEGDLPCFTRSRPLPPTLSSPWSSIIVYPRYLSLHYHHDL